MNAFLRTLPVILICLVVNPSFGFQANFDKQSRFVGPDYVTPSAATSPNWIDFNNPNVISAAHAVDDYQWWNGFGDPEIPKIVAAANQGNLSLQAALLRIERQHYERSVAVGNLFPQGQEAFAEYQRNQFSDNGNQFGIPGLGNTFNFYQLGFNASWEIDLWGRIRRAVQASTAQLQASVEDERDIRLSLTADVISAYIEIRVYQQRILNAHEQIEAQEKTLSIAKSKFKNGSESKLDVSQAQATLEVIRSRVPGLQSELRHSNNRLCLLLGIPPKDLANVMGEGGIPYATNALVVGMPRDLLRRRPDVRRAERIVAQQSALIGVAKAELYPAFSLRGTINWQSFNTSNLISSGSNAGSIIPGVRWDILNYGRNKNRVRAQETQFRESVIAYREAVLNANTEVENSLNGFLNKQEQVALLEKAVVALRESLDVGDKQYKAGTIEFDRLNDLRKELVEQLDVLAIEKGKATLFLIRVYKTMGGGWSIPQSQFCDVTSVPNVSAKTQVPLLQIPFSQEQEPPLPLEIQTSPLPKFSQAPQQPVATKALPSREVGEVRVMTAQAHTSMGTQHVRINSIPVIMVGNDGKFENSNPDAGATKHQALLLHPQYLTGNKAGTQPQQTAIQIR
ncbi:MAG: efflux transporter outer membrane subunit [Mariniblastus sp.]